MNPSLKYKIALTLIPNIGDILAKRLVAYCGSVEAVFEEKKYNHNFVERTIYAVEQLLSSTNYATSY